MTDAGAVCEHPVDAVRWDAHRAILRCTACGRELPPPEREGDE